jgi:hypothetical protein
VNCAGRLLPLLKFLFPAARAAYCGRCPELSIISGDLSPEMRFRNQCEHWWRKHYRLSARRPEIPKDFRRAQFPPTRAKAAKRILRAMY